MSRAKIIEPGTRFGRLVVGTPIKRLGHRGIFYCCDCDCGGTAVVFAGHLRAGSTKGCGCARKGVNKTHGMSNTPEYRAWENARARCNNPRNTKFPEYGGRGITMCAAWANSFDAFFECVGPRTSSKHSLDRIDTYGNYEPGNCRWATAIEQNNNRRPMKRRRS